MWNKIGFFVQVHLNLLSLFMFVTVNKKLCKSQTTELISKFKKESNVLNKKQRFEQKNIFEETRPWLWRLWTRKILLNYQLSVVFQSFKHL